MDIFLVTVQVGNTRSLILALSDKFAIAGANLCCNMGWDVFLGRFK
jgi:hypothetical protein